MIESLPARYCAPTVGYSTDRARVSVGFTEAPSVSSGAVLRSTLATGGGARSPIESSASASATATTAARRNDDHRTGLFIIASLLSKDRLDHRLLGFQRTEAHGGHPVHQPLGDARIAVAEGDRVGQGLDEIARLARRPQAADAGVESSAREEAEVGRG